MRELAEFLYDNLVEAVFPYKCSCGKWGKPICDDCFKQIFDTKTELCPLCKKISEMGRVCPNCRYKTQLTGVMVLGPHEGVLKDSIWRLKYGPIKVISLPLADILTAKYGDFLREKRFVITPVPTSSQRLIERGYNQSEEIAKAVSKKTGLSIQITMARPKNTLHQVGLTRKERLVNAVGTINYIGEDEPTKRKIVVVDDVYTTGATLEECATVLRQAGYREVWGLVISRD